MFEKLITTLKRKVYGPTVRDWVAEESPEHKDHIYAAQRSELSNDDICCELCNRLDGIVISPDDDLTRTKIFHPNCRGIWVAILDDEVNPPLYSDPKVIDWIRENRPWESEEKTEELMGMRPHRVWPESMMHYKKNKKQK